MASLLQRIFRRPDYRSDVTQFIEQLKEQRPDIEAQQRAGRDQRLDVRREPAPQRGEREERGAASTETPTPSPAK